MLDAVSWAKTHKKRWAFTTSNAGSQYFRDFNRLDRLDRNDWQAVNSRNWKDQKDSKQAEFLIEKEYPFELVKRIGVYSTKIEKQVRVILQKSPFTPLVETKKRNGTIEGAATVIEYKSGDILKEDAEALVNTVNCVGAMGRGIALQFKKAFPDNFRAYSRACGREEVRPGRMFVFETNGLTPPKYIINFPTKRHWRGKSRMEDIESGLKSLAEEIRNRNIRSIAIPPLGSGLGGLDWEEVRRRIEESLADLTGVRIVVFEPRGTPAAGKMVRSKKIPAMTPGRAALVGLMHRYLAGLMDPFITLLEIHKLMYFLQEAGEPLKLDFEAGLYGPYAMQLRHVLNGIEGYYISGYADGGDSPGKEIDLVPGAVDDARNYLQDHPQTLERFGRVSDLVDGFESTFGLELLSTTHWVAQKSHPVTLDQLVIRIHGWNDRKRQFTPRQIAIAAKILMQKGWIDGIDIQEIPDD